MNAPATTATPVAAVLDPRTPPPEVTKAVMVADRLYKASQALVIDSPEGYEAAAADLVDLRARWKEVEAQRVHLKEPYLEGGRRIDAFFAVPLQRLADAANVVKAGMVAFKDEEDRKAEEARKAEERRIREEREALERQQREAEAAQRAAREEADRIAREAQAAADAERARLEAEAAAAAQAGDVAAAEEARLQAEAAQADADRQAAAAREAAAAAELEAQQQAEAAQAAIDLADVAPAAPVPVSRAVAAGVSGRKTWKVHSVDKAALVIAAGKAAEAGDESLLAYLDVNETALNGVARALKAAARVAGVVFREVTSIATTGRR